MKIDFDSLSARLLQRAKTILPQWFPEGKFEGHEFVVGNLYGSRGNSLKINTTTGVWTDFADRGTGGGDIISLYAAMHAISQGEAARELDDNPGIPSTVPPPPKIEKPAPEWTPITPVPDDAPPLMLPSGRTRKIYNPKAAGTSKEWPSFLPKMVDAYRSADGSLLGYVIRVEYPGYKMTPQITYCQNREGERQWCMVGFQGKRPLLGLPELAARPDAPVLLVSGEKCWHAALKMAPGYTPVTWIGGDNGWTKTEWTPLKGRRVLMWPDADRARDLAGELIAIDWQSGTLAMWQIGHLLLSLCPEVKLILPEGVESHGWDAADALAEGWDWPRLRDWAKPRIILLSNENTQKYIPTATPAVPVVESPQEPDPAQEQPSRPSVIVSPKPPELLEPSPDGVKIEPIGASVIAKWAEWGLDKSASGHPLCNVNNVARVMENHPTLKKLVWDDTFLQRKMTDKPAREWADVDDINLTVFLQRDLGLTKMTKEIVKQAVTRHAHLLKRNCVQEWAEKLEWNGQSRIETFFIDTFGSPDTPYCRAASRNFWISIAARIFMPGCKVDNMIILEGAQGLKKSSAVAAIGHPWFAEQHETATNPKAFAEIIQGKLIIEISEMDAFSRAEVGRIKQVITCQSDRFRNPFATYATDHPRQCVLIGTINGNEWNRDVTGARRFWPIVCRHLGDVRYVRKHREQLFAEAIAVLRTVPLDAPEEDRVAANAAWWVMPEEETKEEQDLRYIGDPWEQAISEYVARERRVTILDIMSHLKIETARQDMAIQMRISKCLKRLKWEKVQFRDGVDRHWCYEREKKEK